MACGTAAPVLGLLFLWAAPGLWPASQTSVLFLSFLSSKMGLERGTSAGCWGFLPPALLWLSIRPPWTPILLLPVLGQVSFLLGPPINQIWKTEPSSITVKRQVGRLKLREEIDLPEVARKLAGELGRSPEPWAMILPLLGMTR